MITQKIVSRFYSSNVLFECELPEGLASGLAVRHALEKAVQQKAYLRGAYLSGADLRGAYLSGADLRGADLSGADLRGAYLRDSYLSGADLSDADLSGAYLRGADLSGADLSGVERVTDEQAIDNLDKVREIILDDKSRLEMGHWHDDASDWKNKSCAEEVLCGTTHCLAGWLQVCSTDEKVRGMETQLAGIVQAPIAAKMFFSGGDEVLSWLDERKYVAELAENAKRREERAARKAAQGAQDER